mmetsp:Transcript_51707/g.102551  ORF Transcript_51707/g.102551 Transcript_51707/m.102551 type:complete len:83 (+) Transcript_51707:226-474(+)
MLSSNVVANDVTLLCSQTSSSVKLSCDVSPCIYQVSQLLLSSLGAFKQKSESDPALLFAHYCPQATAIGVLSIPSPLILPLV